MRKLVYRCYHRDIFFKTVNTLKEANEWKAEHSKNTVKESLIDVIKEETTEEKEKRLKTIAKKEAIRKAKRIAQQ